MLDMFFSHPPSEICVKNRMISPILCCFISVPFEIHFDSFAKVAFGHLDFHHPVEFHLHTVLGEARSVYDGHHSVHNSNPDSAHRVLCVWRGELRGPADVIGSCWSFQSNKENEISDKVYALLNLIGIKS